jgi:hypothetical protein
VLFRRSRQAIGCVVTALAVALLSLTPANAESAPDNSARNWDEVFAQVLPDQKKVSITRQIDWLDDSTLSYAKSKPSNTAAVPWVAQPLPAVDGFNFKIDGYGGEGEHNKSFYGANGSFSVPLAQQWGFQADGALASDKKGVATYGGGGHLFWRDPSIGLLGAYGSYSHWNGGDLFARVRRLSDDAIFLVNLGQISMNTGRYAAEGEYYVGRWTFSGVAGVEMVSINSTLLTFSVPNRFFDHVAATYYLTDNFKVSAGHTYTSDTHFLTLGSEYGFALGGGRMAALFAEGRIGEGGRNAVLAAGETVSGFHPG